ncbi:hypothetical protein RclHR1_04260009 [Rhizophagus clarus]|uniref:BACK domain-containing protein n=1 Tax=Rhizophagus clarus TaxID=94130 RepID=A0A2Z6SAP8_9GLOM|nr:hypothetical protein RclHR1_04260009 [Rhizophagus clarus]
MSKLFPPRSRWICGNSAIILSAVIKFDSCRKLQDYCFEVICDDPLPFLSSKAFPLTNKDVFFCLLQRDDLSIEETIVWDYLLEWGIEQTPGLGNENSDRTKWNDDENYETLKLILNQFIPLVRFLEVSHTDFFHKVCPYKNIIPISIYEEIERFHYKNVLPTIPAFPPRIGSIFKINIIKSKLTNIIINWIGRKHAMRNRTKNDSLYKFNLVYQVIGLVMNHLKRNVKVEWRV